MDDLICRLQFCKMKKKTKALVPDTENVISHFIYVWSKICLKLVFGSFRSMRLLYFVFIKIEK